MDSPRDTDRTSVLDTDSERDRRDVRDVLRDLVVVEGQGRDDLSLSAVARATAGSDRLVPELLAALDDDATPVRIGAAWALCALADDQPAAVGYLASRLAERAGDDAPFEVGQVLSYLKGSYPGRVADAIDATVAAERGEFDPTPGDAGGSGSVTCETDPDAGGRRGGEPARPGGSARADKPVRTDGGADQGKRIETDGGVPTGTVADLGDGRQVVRSTERPDAPTRPARPTPARQRGDAPTGPGRRRPATPDEPPADHPTHPDFESNDADAPEVETRTAGADAATPRTESASGSGRSGSETPSDPAGPSPTSERAETPDTFAAIGSLSSLDRLSAVDRGVEERYATGYRCRAVRDEEEMGVAVRLFERPEEGDRLAFRADLEDCLARWQALGEAEQVVGVAEWGVRPRPWVRTQAVDDSMAGRERPPVDRAVDQAVDLASAVATLHGQGAVHGGIDPKNVVYPCDPLDALDRPMLDNVGLMGAFRTYFEPAKFLDPRFAAPEYFDDDFGSVDAATDVYGLGATVYYLTTGRPPFVGSYGDVREGVLGERPPAPSAVDDAVPAGLDRALGKALAKEKLKRYESVEAFRADLKRVRDGR